VNYIITSTFIGEAIELLRLPDLVFYIYIIATAKSTAERGVIRHVRIYLIINNHSKEEKDLKLFETSE
jgi:hypothetical protein